MILNNTQANIFKVNGGIADNFANRPAANGSFYIFYSIDTQEIYYDNGAWILIGSSAGGGVNIYNSNGTLTGNRILSGANNDLNFADLNIFKTSLGGNDIGLKLMFASNRYEFGDYNVINNGTLITIDDLASNIQLVAGFNATNLRFVVDEVNAEIKSRKGNNDIGLKLDFANQTHFIGDPLNGVLNINSGGGILEFIWLTNNKLLNVDSSGIVGFGDLNNMVGGTKLITDFANSVIKTETQGGDIGLKLDFANNLYQFGQITGGNNAFIEIDDTRPRIGTKFFGSSFNDGFDIVGNEYAVLGFTSSVNQLQFQISETGNEITTRNNNGVNGFRLDYNNQNFKFGYFTIPTNLWFEIDNTTKIIKTINNQNNNGLKLDFATQLYELGQITGGSQTVLQVSDTSPVVNTMSGGDNTGIYLDFNLRKYQFGLIGAPGNNTTFIIDDSVINSPIQFTGNNITSGTAGSNSGQHLKININGVDYKIELRNP